MNNNKRNGIYRKRKWNRINWHRYATKCSWNGIDVAPLIVVDQMKMPQNYLIFTVSANVERNFEDGTMCTHTHIRFQFCNQKMSHAILRADRERKISDIYLHLSLEGVGTFGRRIPLHRKYLIYLQRSSIARNNFPADKVFSWWVRTSNVLCNVRAMAHRRRWFLLGSGKYSRMRIVCKCYATLNGRLETAKNKKMRSNGCRAIYRNLNVVVICNSRK